MAKKAKPVTKNAQTAPYKHPEAKSLMRPEVGTQAQFKKKKPPKTYRYDSSLSPALDWDAKNPAREQGEALITQVLDAKTLTRNYVSQKDCGVPAHVLFPQVATIIWCFRVLRG